MIGMALSKLHLSSSPQAFAELEWTDEEQRELRVGQTSFHVGDRDC